MINIIRILLAIPVSVGGLVCLATAASIYLGYSNETEETAITLIVMGCISLFLSTVIYPDKSDEDEHLAASETHEQDLQWDDEGRIVKAAAPQTVPESGPQTSPALNDLLGMLKTHMNMQMNIPPSSPAASSSPASSRPAASVPSVSSNASPAASRPSTRASSKPAGIADELVAKGRDLLLHSRWLHPGDAKAKEMAKGLRKTADKLADRHQRLENRLNRIDQQDGAKMKGQWNEADMISDLIFDLKYEADRLLDLDETSDW